MSPNCLNASLNHSPPRRPPTQAALPALLLNDPLRRPLLVIDLQNGRQLITRRRSKRMVLVGVAGGGAGMGWELVRERDDILVS